MEHEPNDIVRGLRVVPTQDPRVLNLEFFLGEHKLVVWLYGVPCLQPLLVVLTATREAHTGASPDLAVYIMQVNRRAVRE
jgi:hypothetical protein